MVIPVYLPSLDLPLPLMVAIELGLLFAIHHGYSEIHFFVKSDNQGVIQAIEGGKSRSPEQNSVLPYCFHSTSCVMIKMALKTSSEFQHSLCTSVCFLGYYFSIVDC